ncbi:MAG: hypothetical protein ACI84C_001410, partial [Flavobacteriales bacterium]
MSIYILELFSLLFLLYCHDYAQSAYLEEYEEGKVRTG